jgi:Spy/CpxP family protein refolding chaperone
MARQTAWILPLVLAYALPATAAGVCDEPPQHSSKDERSSSGRSEQRSRWKWWLYDREELGITDQQSAEIDRIFESTIPQQRETRRRLDQMEKQLEKMIEEGTADVATVAQQVEGVEALRAQANKTRTLLLYRMHRVLTAEQRAKVQALVERRESERRRQSDQDRKR